ncbi:MAG: hypothetical protein H6546_04115 [Chitinophagales bacterium]|nr:hypothetical protein [Chitinophagales bacterium]MCB9019494.1 hypothetical protein [Chitinophagales bacterium]HQU40125.1 hypothetical protein [Chitinophagales bacterium]HQU76840.1 hypothetical protein [Chitinophagales bacterium]
MKYPLSLFLMTLVIAGCTDKKEPFIRYNDVIVEQVYLADSTLRDVFSFRDFETFPDRHPGYDASFEGIRKSLHDLEAMEEDSLRQAAMDLVNAYEGIVDDDYATIYQLMHDSIYTQSDSIQVDSLSAEMYAKWQIYSEKFASTQKHFARKNGISLDK